MDKTPQALATTGVTKVAVFIGKALVFVLPVVLGIYATRFIDRKILKGKVKSVAE